MKTEKKQKKTKTKEIVLFRKVSQTGYISVSKFLAGTIIEIRFRRQLTKEEEMRLKLNQLYQDLKKIREERRKAK